MYRDNDTIADNCLLSKDAFLTSLETVCYEEAARVLSPITPLASFDSSRGASQPPPRGGLLVSDRYNIRVSEGPPSAPPTLSTVT